MDRKGIIVHMYHDVDINPSDSHILIKDFGKEFYAENLILRGCKDRNIGAHGFYIFGLVTGDFKIWLPPSEKVTCTAEELQEFWLRIRFIPSMEGIHILVRECKEALNYFFLQCRHDFVNDRISTKGKIGQEHILGLGVVDMLRWGKEKKMDLSQLKKEDPKKFIPSSAKKLFRYPWDNRRLSINFNNELDKLDNVIEVSVAEYKLRYINGFLKYTIQYGIEKFETNDNQTVIVDPNHECHGIYVQKPKMKYESICSIYDVMHINSQANGSERRVIISRKHEGIPKTLMFSEEKSALSFISLVDGYHRLIADFHYHVSSEVFSPMLRELSKLKCHGPVRKKWADDRLLQKHLKHKNFNYLLTQSNKFHWYTLTLVIHQDRPELKTLGILKNEEGKWQLNFGNPPTTFENVSLLLQYYRKSNDRNVSLERYVPPTSPLDSSIYLCREVIKNEDSDDRINQEMKSQVGLISGINVRQTQENIEGNFTDLVRTLWEKDPTQLQKVAVKRLKPKFSPQYLEEFMESMHRVTFWKCPTLVNIHAICLSPFQVILENTELGNLEKYLHDSPVAEADFAGIADQIAQALLHIHGSLQEHGGSNSGYHGAVRCRNVFVFGNESVTGSDNTMRVKLGDPGMLSLYNKLPLDNPFNEERLPWIAPELYSPKVNLGANNQYSDIYSYGVFLWELFSVGERPFKSLNIRQIFTTVLFGDGLIPPDGCTVLVADLIKLCTQLDVDKRPNIKEVVRDLGKIIHDCSGPHMYNQVQFQQHNQGTYSVDSGDNGAELPESEQNAVIESLLEQSKHSSFSQSDRRSSIQMLGQNTSTGPIPPSPAPSSLNSFGQWDSRTPLVPPSSSVSSIPHPTSIQKQYSLDTNASGASRATMTTLLDGDAASEATKPVRSIQQRPLPAKPTVPLDELTHIIHPDRLDVNDTVILGKGHYGEVHTAYYRLSSGEKQKVAVKSLKVEMYERFHTEFDEECSLMTRLEHPNIVQIIGQCSEKENHTTLLVMEFVENGCLRDFLQNKRNHIRNNPNEKQEYDKQLPLFLRFSKEVAKGMIYLSRQKIVHRDLAARNVLVTKKITLKISDFGLARTLAVEKDYYSMSDRKAEIPAFWCAPESLDPRKFSVKTDVWSYGVTMWEIYSFAIPPRLCKIESLFYVLNTLGTRLPKPQLCPQDIFDNVINKCWYKEPEKRLSFEAIETILEREEKQQNAGVGNGGSFVTGKVMPNRFSDTVQPPTFKPQSLNATKTAVALAQPTESQTLTITPPKLSQRESFPAKPIPQPALDVIQNDVSAGIQTRSLPDVPEPNLHDSHELDTSQLFFNRDASIGKGHYGQVFKGKYLQKEVAIKLLLSNMLQAHEDEFNQECKMMIKLDHPNIVKVVGQCLVPEKTELSLEPCKEISALVMEYVPKGCLALHLRHLLNKCKEKKLKEEDNFPQFIRYLLEIAEGMIYLHSKGIVHRDLATRNILVTSDNHMKISDFGLARILDKNRDYYQMKDHTKNIPVYWCAPESLQDKKFTVKSDIWSYGVVMWEVFMFAEQPKLSDTRSLLTALQNNKRLEKPKKINPDIYNRVMSKCWEMEPSKRLSFSEIKQLLSQVQTLCSQ